MQGIELAPHLAEVALEVDVVLLKRAPLQNSPWEL